jgi:hypothetical protein
MLTLSDFLLASVPKDDTEFRSYLETRSPDGESIIDHIARTGIDLATERECFERGKALRAHMAAKRGQRKLTG